MLIPWPGQNCDVACIWLGPFGSHDGSAIPGRTFNFAFEITAPDLICISRLRQGIIIKKDIHIILFCCFAFVINHWTDKGLTCVLS